MNNNNLWQKALIKTSILFEKIGIGQTQWNDSDLEACEEALLLADAGLIATNQIIDDIKKNGDRRMSLKSLLIETITNKIIPLECDLNLKILNCQNQPQVIVIVGVNGSGKTTTIAKLTHFLLQHGKSVVLAAADTFRAAAREQLQHWANNQAVRVISQSTSDPAAVCFDTINSAITQKKDFVLIDTAGRLSNQKNLMAEIARIDKVCTKVLAGIPHESWIILDGNSGQNSLTQVTSFNQSINLSGIIISKLDGSAKGGFLLNLANLQPKIPIVFIGTGEKPENLRPFSAKDYAVSIIN